MAAHPPQSDRSDTVPGYLMVLVAFSVLVLLFALGAGLVGFGIVDLDGESDPPAPTAGTGESALQSSGFTVRDQRLVDNRQEIDVSVAVTNTSDERLENTTMMVQCLDGGNASNSQLILGIDPDQTLQFELTLYGTGEPRCAEPIIGFDTP